MFSAEGHGESNHREWEVLSASAVLVLPLRDEGTLQLLGNRTTTKPTISQRDGGC